MQKGKLYLIPVSIGETTNELISPYNFVILNSINEFIVEDIRSARRYLSKIGFSKPINNIVFNVLNEHTTNIEITSYLDTANIGGSIGLLSESGCPAVADPGSMIVELAHQTGIRVIPLIGPSSIVLALMASGFNGQCFAFLGYLPVNKEGRIKKIKEIEADIYKKEQTQIFIETPYRNNAMLKDLIECCRDSTKLCVAVDITTQQEQIIVMNIKDWRKKKFDLNKRLTVYLLYK